MFQKCYAISGNLDLPATTLPDKCYYKMFDGARSTNTKVIHVPASMTNISADTFGDNTGVSVMYDI